MMGFPSIALLLMMVDFAMAYPCVEPAEIP